MDSRRTVFLGSSLRDLRAFPEQAKRIAGYQLYLVESGEDPDDWKPVKEVGPGAREIRISTNQGSGRIEHRVFYVATFAREPPYVLHAFRKDGRKTSRADLHTGRQRYGEMVALRRQRGS